VGCCTAHAAGPAAKSAENKYLRIILNTGLDTHIIDLHREANIESVDQVIAKLLAKAYKHDHDNSLIRNTSNYNIEEVHFKIRCRLPKHFQPIMTYE